MMTVMKGTLLEQPYTVKYTQKNLHPPTRPDSSDASGLFSPSRVAICKKIISTDTSMQQHTHIALGMPLFSVYTRMRGRLIRINR